MQFLQLDKITGGKITQFSVDRPIADLITDSRKVIPGEGSIFFAIPGERNDGHNFIHALFELGVKQFIVERSVDSGLLNGANILQVTSTVDALQRIVRARREQFQIPVIGVTGSNGKTIIKEWLFQLLSREYIIIKNPGSYNSQVGVPLSVWKMQSEHQLGIFEAGISKPGEMEKLEAIIQPSLVLFTNIGTAHDEGFGNPDEKITEKLKLSKRSNVLVFCADHLEVKNKVKELGIPSFSWSLKGNADVVIQKTGSDFRINTSEKEFTVALPFTDKASIENCLHCITLMLYLKYDHNIISERIQSLRSISMRLELKEGINQSQVIDDSYNNDLGGLQISLDFLKNQKQKKKKSLILSDMLQTGLSNEEMATKIADLVKRSDIDSFVGIGPVLYDHKNKFNGNSSFHRSTDDFLNLFEGDKYQDQIILVKGARAFQFEKIVNQLQRKVHGTIMEIDLGALIHNLNFFRSRLPGTKIMVMVKAFAYGSGSTEIANVLQYHRVDYLGVAYADEGIDLRRNNITIPIMVMNPSEESFEQLLAYKLEPEVYSFKMLKSFIDFLKLRPCSVHLKLDTGMHRLGFDEADLDELISILKNNNNIQVASIFSHLAGADEEQHDDFSKLQGEKFKVWADRISSALGYKPLYHLLNSPGILRLPQLHFDMVRLGIGLYGIDPSSLNSNLKPVATLKTIISQIKHIPKGESIGYSRKGIAANDMTLATLAIGYADGFSRAFSNGKGQVLIHGKRAPVVGNVCMDMTMVDITGIPANEGDEAILFGDQLSIQEVAAMANTIPYEILTSTSERVKRVFVAESI